VKSIEFCKLLQCCHFQSNTDSNSIPVLTPKSTFSSDYCNSTKIIPLQTCNSAVHYHTDIVLVVKVHKTWNSDIIARLHYCLPLLSLDSFTVRLYYMIIYKYFIRHYDSKLNKNRMINNSSDERGPIQRAQYNIVVIQFYK